MERYAGTLAISEPEVIYTIKLDSCHDLKGLFIESFKEMAHLNAAAQAVMQEHPDVTVAIGPSPEDSFTRLGVMLAYAPREEVKQQIWSTGEFREARDGALRESFRDFFHYAGIPDTIARPEPNCAREQALNELGFVILPNGDVARRASVPLERRV